MNIKTFTGILIIFFLSLCVPQFSFAAEFLVSSGTQTIHAQDEFIVDLSADTQGTNINALAGIIAYPADILELKEIRDGNSIINFWVDAPTASSSSVSFSGIIPGGYTGKGSVLSIVFLAKQAGLGTIGMTDSHMLNNDGSGSEVPTTVSPFSLSIQNSSSTQENAVSPIIDTTMPETFVPELAQDSNIFNGAWFVAFSTNDKGSGIAKYQVKETKYPLFSSSAWHDATSPYLLVDQNLQSYIFVKAIDQAGNARVETIAPKNPIPFYANLEYLFIILVVVVIAFLFQKSLWKKHKK